MTPSLTMIAISTWMTVIDNKLSKMKSTFRSSIMRRELPQTTLPTSQTSCLRLREQHHNFSNKLHRLFQQANRSHHSNTHLNPLTKPQQLTKECLIKCQMLSFNIRCNR